MALNIKRISEEELQEQRKYAIKDNELLLSRYGKRPKACVITYGCQQNVADSEKIKGMLFDCGYDFTEEREQAQFILFNTCAVREHAEDRVFGNVGALKKYKKSNPDVIIALCGCMMQQKGIAKKIRSSYPYVDMVFGTHVVHELPQYIHQILMGKKHVLEIPDADGVIAEGLPVKRDNDKKAFIPIMYGCNNFCTYCIVPYVKGRERSREMNDIISEFKQLVSDGYKEITLLGQNVNSYGKDLSEKVTFSELLQTLNDIEGDFRIRFMTSHPKDCTKELLDTMANGEKIAKHLHLPFQCGSDRVLKAMNRGYTSEKYLSLIDYARSVMGEELAITSDVIVGFPGETYEDFLQTIDLVKKLKATSLFTFIYSPREGTPAAEYDDPIEYEDKSKWMRQLLEVQEEVSASQMQIYKDKVCKCFVYGKGKSGENYLAARNDANLVVEFEGGEKLIGTFQNVKITEPRTYVLRGEIERI